MGKNFILYENYYSYDSIRTRNTAIFKTEKVFNDKTNSKRDLLYENFLFAVSLNLTFQNFYIHCVMVLVYIRKERLRESERKENKSCNDMKHT